MLSKKEIRKSKKSLNEFAYTKFGTFSVKEAKTILQYIQELEISNAELDKENKKIEFERDEANKEIRALKKRNNISYGY